jgi:hypothetical protein
MPRRTWNPWFVALLAPWLADVARAQPVVRAGKDQTLAVGQKKTFLTGSVRNLSPLDYWTADGDHATEDMLLEYDDATGLTAVAKMTDAAGKVYGWPSDFESIKGQVYGFDVFQKRLYTIDGTTARVTPIGSALGYSSVFGLGYDDAHDVLYAVDQKTRKVFTIDYTSGKATVVLTLPSAHSDVHGLAYRTSDNQLYYSDDKTSAIYRCDPSQPNSTPVLVLALNDGADLLDEIDFWNDRLFGMLRHFDSASGLWSAQLVEIDLAAGTSKAWGPSLSDVSTHALLVNTLPEKVEWVQVAGPAPVVFDDVTDPKTKAKFPVPGYYLLELRAIGPTTTVSDRVRITVPQPVAPAGPPPPPMRKV